jgi:hypothetical protein
MHEQRRHSRLKTPVDATFYGRSGGSPCHVSDISWGGCFVQTLTTAKPMVGEDTVITFYLDGSTVRVVGTVQYIDPSIGFAVEFAPLSADATRVLTSLLGDPPDPAET